MNNKHCFFSGMAAGEGGADSPSLHTRRSKSYPKATLGSFKGKSYVISIIGIVASLLFIVILTQQAVILFLDRLRL